MEDYVNEANKTKTEENGPNHFELSERWAISNGVALAFEIHPDPDVLAIRFSHLLRHVMELKLNGKRNDECAFDVTHLHTKLDI